MYINAPANILRVELKVKRMKFIKETGIRTFGDLCSKDKLIRLSAKLQQTHSKCVYEEELKLAEMQSSELIEYKDLTSPKYIVKEINNSYRRTKWLDRLAYFNKQYGLSEKKKCIESLIHQKIQQLS